MAPGSAGGRSSCPGRSLEERAAKYNRLDGRAAGGAGLDCFFGGECFLHLPRTPTRYVWVSLVWSGRRNRGEKGANAGFSKYDRLRTGEKDSVVRNL